MAMTQKPDVFWVVVGGWSSGIPLRESPGDLPACHGE